MLTHVAMSWPLLSRLPLQPHPHVRHPLDLSARLYGHCRRHYLLEPHLRTHGRVCYHNNRHLRAAAIRFIELLLDQQMHLQLRYQTQVSRTGPGRKHGTC